jgi:hypothetical protein
MNRAFLIVLLLAGLACKKGIEYKSREDVIPPDAVKVAPATDSLPPVPMEGPANTAGAEDSPFITPDGSRFFFFFTPDVRVPVEKQVLDGATGIWECHREGSSWSEP